MFYVISYDIPDDKRRNQLAKVLKGSGTRVQYSVFEAHLNRKQYEELKRIVAGVIDASADSVRYYVLCHACVGRIEVPAVGKVIPFLNKYFTLTKSRFVVAQFIALLHAETFNVFQNH